VANERRNGGDDGVDVVGRGRVPWLGENEGLGKSGARSGSESRARSRQLHMLCAP